jgi:hypothetical protein
MYHGKHLQAPPHAEVDVARDGRRASPAGSASRRAPPRRIPRFPIRSSPFAASARTRPARPPAYGGAWRRLATARGAAMAITRTGQDHTQGAVVAGSRGSPRPRRGDWCSRAQPTSPDAGAHLRAKLQQSGNRPTECPSHHPRGRRCPADGRIRRRCVLIGTPLT